MKKINIKNIQISDVTTNGDGVAKKDGYPYFVRGALTGDVLDIKITKENKSYGFAETLKIVTPSPYRREPVCREFLKCGGCDLMHSSYDFQKNLKEKFVVDNMRKIGGYEKGSYELDEFIGSENCLNYRNKAQFPVQKSGGKLRCGFYSKKSHDLVPCENCAIEHPDINLAVNAVLNYANAVNLSAYNEKTHSGTLRHIYVRRGNFTGDIMAVLVTNSKKPLPKEDLLIKTLLKIPNVKSIVQNINTDKTNLILGEKNRVIWGSGEIISNIGNLKFKVSPHSFFQVNGEQTEKLYKKALEYANVSKNDTVFDLYCGAGTITLFLSEFAKETIGVEIVAPAVENAEENAKLNGINNASFHCGDCAKIVNRLLKDGKKADVVVVDPPRKGCSPELLELVRDMQPNRLVYVSCNCATLARDVKILSDYGFKLKKLCPADMFPQTTHVETVALLTKA